MNFLMTTGTQTSQIALIIRAAVSQRLHVMNESCHRRSPQPKALLAERMRRDISVTDFLPRIAVSLMLIVATGEMLVVTLHEAPMFLAVACLAVGQIWTASVTAGAFWFRWHRVHLDFWHEKTSAGIAPLGGHDFFTLFYAT